MNFMDYESGLVMEEDSAMNARQTCGATRK